MRFRGRKAQAKKSKSEDFQPSSEEVSSEEEPEIRAVPLKSRGGKNSNSNSSKPTKLKGKKMMEEEFQPISEEEERDMIEENLPDKLKVRPKENKNEKKKRDKDKKTKSNEMN